MAQQDTAIRLLKRWDELWGQQATARTVWQDIADYVIPYKSNILVQRAEGEKQTAKLYDATAPHSAILLAASIHASMTPAPQPWLSLRMRHGGRGDQAQGRGERVRGVLLYGTTLDQVERRDLRARPVAHGAARRRLPERGEGDRAEGRPAPDAPADLRAR